MARKKSTPKAPIAEPHPWRLCPAGMHWVSTHPMRIPPSKRHPTGSATIRRAHCAKNPTGKVQLYPDKILEITQQSFKNLKPKPCPNDLGFKKNSNSARGLMQILNSTRKTLGDESGELRDHFLTVTKNDLNDPSVNICAGIRWLFQKQKLSSSYLNKEASWVDAVMNYKGKMKSKTSDLEAAKQKKIFQKYLDKLVTCEN